jgi:sigma-E factor negative regulatory protein RseA
MNEILKERVSALVDGELEAQSASETVDVLIASHELQLHWSRYHLVRDVLRHKVYPDARSELCVRVRERLADEALHFPVQQRRFSERWRGALKPAAGMALAASVALVAIVAVRSLGELPRQPATAALTSSQETSQQTTPGRAAVQVTGSGLPAVIPASVSANAQIRPAALRRLQWNTSEPAVANRLNGYLVNHSEHLGGPIGGLHPYARIVGYDTASQR